MLALAACTVPFVAYGVAELMALRKRRRDDAISRRRKGPHES